VISEFPSLDKAIAAHESPGYQQALGALVRGHKIRRRRQGHSSDVD
jgi:hypothetical protein